MKNPTISRVLGVERIGLTHALRIPLATRTSRPQLESSLRKVMSDPTASNIHPAAFGPPDMHFVHTGTLSLERPEIEAKTLQVLEELDLERMLLQCSQSRGLGIGKEHPQPQTLPSRMPLRVSLSGLAYNSSLHDCRRLYAPIVDHTGILPEFTQAIRKQFAAAGLIAVDPRLPFEAGPPPLQTKIIHNRNLQLRTANTKPSVISQLSQGQVAYRLASFDVRDLYSKFKDVTWAANFALERLSLSLIGSRDIVKDGRIIGRGFQETASVPLPGVKRLEAEPELQGVEYVRPRAIFL